MVIHRLASIALLGLAASCRGGGGSEAATEAAIDAAIDAGIDAAIDAGAFGNAEALAPTPSIPGPAGPGLAGLGGVYLADVESCGACHPDAFEQQQASVHALASFNNPIYRVAVERLRADKGHEASDMCAGCHDAALLADGAMEGSVEAPDPRAHNGVSCRLCHGIETAGRDGNGSFTLGATPLPIPVDGDPASLLRHKEAVAPPPISELCGSCHQSFLSPGSGNEYFLGGQNEMLAWANSAYAGQGAARIDQVEAKDCVGCHMPKVAAPRGDVVAAKTGTISSHRSLGGHTWMAAMRGDSVQQGRQEEFLALSATVDSMPVSWDGNELAIDVVVRNTGVGHRFPGGVRDSANTRIQVTVLDAAGRVLLRSAPGDGAHVLRAYLADAEGTLLDERETHRFAALVADHTIPPRDVAVVRYRGVLLPGATPAVVTTELIHQSRSAELAVLSCAESRSARGQRFARRAAEWGAGAADACAPQPQTVIARSSRAIDDEAGADFDRLYEHGLGLLHELQERADAAGPSLQAALAAASGDREQAMALLALGQLASRVGRVDEALALLARAERLVPAIAAIPASRGDALAKVWRWHEAADAYAEAVALAPGNASLWRRYALALGSSGQDGLAAAQTGLALAPRDADLLRVQALALRDRKAGSQARAMESYLTHRGADNKGAIIQRCTERSALCAREALPVHEHRLLAPSTRK